MVHFHMNAHVWHWMEDGDRHKPQWTAGLVPRSTAVVVTFNYSCLRVCLHGL